MLISSGASKARVTMLLECVDQVRDEKLCTRRDRKRNAAQVGYSTTLYEKKHYKIGQITISMAITMDNPDLFYLVGGFNPSEKYETSGMIISNVWEKESCSKPPTRYNPIKSH